MEEPGGEWRRRLSPTTPVGIVFFRRSPFYSLTWKQPVVGWWPPLMIVTNSRHTQVGAHPSTIQSIFAAESLTINDYKQLITQDGGLPCLYPTVEIRRMEGGQRQDGGAWGRTEEEDSRQIFLPSHNKLLWKGKVSSPKLSTLLILWLIFSVVLETALRAKVLAR